MIELKLYVSDVDYESVLKSLSGGGIAAAAVAMAVEALPDSAKEEYAVKYINSNAAKLESIMENAITNQGIHLHVSGAQAAIVRDQ